MKHAEFMDQLVHDLIEHYEADVRPSGLIYLELGMKDHGTLIIEEKIKHREMRVCYFLFDGEGNPVPEPELWFYIDVSGAWIPYEINRHTAGHHVFADLEMETGKLLVTDPYNQAALAAFADFWAEILRAQGWIESAYKHVDGSSPKAEALIAWEEQPDWETLTAWMVEENGCEATDGCWVEHDGMCPHGHRSWLLELGLI